jgi:ABC-3C protein
LHRTFPLSDLSDDEFETLIAAISYHVLGTGTIVFAAGRDGGRDATFTGTATQFPSATAPLAGKFVVQAKHTQNPAASCADTEFGRTLRGEHPKITRLIQGGELEHYLVFTNRKKPAGDGINKEAELKALGLVSAHLIGAEQIRLWLTMHPEIWSRLGFDRFETPLRIQTSDITTVVIAFHAELGKADLAVDRQDFTYVAKPQKNKINKLSNAYWEEIRTRSLPYFKTIEDFLSNPRNVDFKDMYEDTADEIRRKLITAMPPFESFDEALTHIIDLVTINNPDLANRRRFATVFLHYMYYTCDIGQHADTLKTP